MPRIPDPEVDPEDYVDEYLDDSDRLYDDYLDDPDGFYESYDGDYHHYSRADPDDDY